MTAKNMDWASVGTGLYDLTSVGGGMTAACLVRNGNAVNDFPTVPELQKNAKLTGNGVKTLVRI